MKCESSPGCIKAALMIMGDKWSPLLLKELAEAKQARYSVLESRLTGISPRTLSQRLEAMTGSGIIVKSPYSTRPLRYEYRLTPKGLELVKVLQAMAKWGEKYGVRSVS